MERAVEDYLRPDKLPHLWCPGCSHGITLRAIMQALADLNRDPTSTVFTTGIGCWGKADDYVNAHAFHGTHGRALAFATGIKVVRPELTVLALMGDGDGATIGGNHLLHAARRNVDITAIVANNQNYGMTGGQYSATTPEGSTTITSRFGTPEPGMDLCDVVAAAGATYVARGTVYHVTQLERLLRDAIAHRGFSFVEVISLCPTYFGRYNWRRSNIEMMHWLRDNAVSQSRFDRLPPERQAEAIVTGRLVKKDAEDFNTRYQRVIEEAQRAYQKEVDRG